MVKVAHPRPKKINSVIYLNTEVVIASHEFWICCLLVESGLFVVPLFMYLLNCYWSIIILQEILENSKHEITTALLKKYPQLLRKYISDKAKISPLIDMMMLMKLELYSLKRQDQVSWTVIYSSAQTFCLTCWQFRVHFGSAFQGCHRSHCGCLL